LMVSAQPFQLRIIIFTLTSRIIATGYSELISRHETVA
jgi:hypothetical protein